MKQPNSPGPSWERLALSDLHVNAATLERACSVLRRVGSVAAARSVPVVMTGDFWDARGVLATKQIDAVLNELDIWHRAGVFAILIPGNHDQVVMDGKIHGLRIFNTFPNVLVATERLLDTQNRIAYIPWREDPQDQGAEFLLDPPNTWTVFGHAEVRGAVSNNGTTVAGRVTLNQIHAVARACYLGHFHKRQKLGDRTFYLGNPFELNMGERGQPKGVAYITSDAVEPTFIDFADFPRHHRIDLRAPVSMPPLREHDVVELVATKAQLRDPSMRDWVEKLPAKDVRPVAVGVLEDDGVPPIAMTIEDAVRAYAEGNPVPGLDVEQMTANGISLVQTVKHLADIADPIGTTCRVISVHGRDFCALSGHFSMDLANQGAVMVRGPQGAGKTALVDSISWCLFDQTSPRRPAAEAASLRGDDVIHDEADEAMVTVVLEVDGDRYEVIRKKRRGKGSRVRVKGALPRPEDLKGDDEWVRQLVGLSYALWRSCVSLGQGSVSNFLTSTDKARKALLSDANGLNVCEPARKQARKLLSASEARISDIEKRVSGVQSVLDHMMGQDFAADALAWETNHAEAVHGKKQAIEFCDDSLIKADRHLADYDDLVAQQNEVAERVKKLERQVTEGPGGEKKRAELIRQIGAAEAERSTVERDKALLSNKLTKLVSESQGQTHGTCPTCGQRWERSGFEHHVTELEQQIRSKDFEISQFSQRISNYEMELSGFQGADSAQRERLIGELEKARASKDELDRRLGILTAIQHNRGDVQRNKASLEAELARMQAETNPFVERAAAHETDLAEKQEELEELLFDLQEEHSEAEAYRYWVDGFGPNGLPVVVMRALAGDLEATANDFLAQLTRGRLWAEVSLADDSLDVIFHEYDSGVWRDRRLEQLSGGQRRCAELAFSPFGLSEMLFRRLRCKVPMMIIDELTAHLGQTEKGLACEIIRNLDRETVVVIDHDPTVQAEFDVIYDLDGNRVTRTK